jgi:hypothetical protein
VQALLAPKYRWLDPQQRSKNDRLLNGFTEADISALAAKV